MFIHRLDDETSLRLFNVGDAEEFFNLIICSKPYLKEWLGWLDYVETVEDTIETIKARLSALVENGGYPKSVAIIYKGQIAGTIGFNEINKGNKIGIIGYWLGEGFQGKGIMTKALNAIVDYGFRELGLNRIEVSIAVENKKSRLLAERVGFVEEGKLREAEWLYDRYVDHIIYSILAKEWKGFKS
ncbi:GNAT family N-acetyltransferase [Sutcliffiella horikoshii]|uniref:GNAT family N-acetyltransferase n=1 Tax=Sutcliffiella horikoshii TaxID=79883 RepID=UPI001CBC798E|nr:GNAT family protein [Sutcliffiella horikoshii]UAL45560.1 GNAT family N-acetyltransferase [Sutcliffiella horikoshii]